MPRTLLLADDSVTIRKVVGITFANEDVKLVTVDNGDDALTRAREIKPDLVLADVSMPGLDGYALCAALKADPELSRIPVLLLTGTFESFDEARAAEAQVDAHIAKPFDAQALVDQVHQLLERDLPTRVEQAPAVGAEAAEETELKDASDFSFDDLEFEPAAKPADEPAVAAPANKRDGDTQAEAAAELGDSLFSESAVLDSLKLAPAEDSASSDGPLAADPFSVDPADDLDSADLDPLGQSQALGELPARPSVPHPADKTMVWEDGKFPLAKEPQAVKEDLAWAEPVAAEPEPLDVPDPLLGGPIELSQPETVIADAEPLPAAEATDAIREVLEKLAWEAFGPLSEQLVREVVKKVEAIAWEVVPDLAERLLQDEIRRMKAHSSD